MTSGLTRLPDSATSPVTEAVVPAGVLPPRLTSQAARHRNPADFLSPECCVTDILDTRLHRGTCSPVA
ncbi:hypothetical protein NDU88_005758 [Pleurodeles waltl]|uniref:Uncharacterized protein n=1 Tax=Pleurodeles waltl TaxID=8319 RepID=A0AAV7TD58_PLEWA|nr:hypothetical protein NDU88_005758 [Pleurodeles waltl]